MTNRSYDDGCATAHALDLIGERWALLVARELMFGPKRFTDLRADLRTISPNVLTQRLEALEANGILRRRKLPPPAASWIYELTDWGQALEEPIIALGKWAARSPFLAQGHPISAAGLLLALKAMYQPPRDGSFRVLLDMDETGAVVSSTHEGLDIRTGDGAQAKVEATLKGTSNALDGILFGGTPLAAALEAGSVTISGDGAAIDRFLKAFPLPPAP